MSNGPRRPTVALADLGGDGLAWPGAAISAHSQACPESWLLDPSTSMTDDTHRWAVLVSLSLSLFHPNTHPLIPITRGSVPADSMTTTVDTQTDLFVWARELKRENKRIAEINAARVRNRGYLVFAIDPTVSPEDPNYCEIYATEARTPNQAAGKIRPLAAGRRLHVYLATGKYKYKHELADARWVA